MKACPLTPEQVKPGLPPSDLGGRLPLLEGFSGDMHWYFSSLSRCRLDEADLPADIPQPKVMVESDEAWVVVVSLLRDHSIVSWTELWDVPHVRGHPLLQAAFGFIKLGKLTESGLAVLRLIMDCRAANAVVLRLLGDLGLVAGMTAMMSLVVLGYETVTFCAEDFVSAF